MKKIRYVLAIVLIAITALLVVACNGAQFNIVFDVDGEVYYTVSTAGEEEVAMPPNPEKENYVFDGWYWDKDIWQIPFTVGSLLDVKLESDLTVYAKWIERDITEKIFDVTFNTMGGTAVEAQKVQYGHLVSKPSDPAKEGQLFAGWYKDPDYKTSWNFAGDVIKENVTVYAKWVADIPENRKYTIAFNSNGGSAVEAYTDLAYNSLITSPDKPTKQGYVFVGWYFDNTYAKEWNWTLDKVTESLTLYAKWVDESDATGCEIINATGFEGEGRIRSTKVPNAQDKFVLSEALTLSPYSSWYVTTDSEGRNVIPSATVNLAVGDNVFYVNVVSGTGTNKRQYEMNIRRRAIYSVTYVLNNGEPNRVEPFEEDSVVTVPEIARVGYTFDKWQYDQEDWNVGNIVTKELGNITLEAVWTANEYEVTLDSNGGNELNPVTLTFGSEYDLDVPTKSGYAFNGWKTEDNIKLTDDKGESIGVWNIAKNTVLYAEWTVNTYRITYNNIEGASNGNRLTYTVEDEDFNLSNATKTGYTFGGWYSNSTLTDAVSQIDTSLALDVIVYAKWTAIEYTATFVADGKTVDTIEFTVETQSLAEPDVTPKAGYSAVWEDYSIVARNITVNAVYTPIVYDITYKNVVGSYDVDTPVNGNPTTYTVETPTITLKNASKTGYTFDGWYAGETKVTAIELGSYGDKELTAKWTTVKYGISYVWDDTIGGYKEGESNPAEYTVEDTIAFNVLENKKNGYISLGWYTAKNEGDGQKVAGISPKTTGNKVLYAHWGLEEYTISYHNVSGVTNTNATAYTVESEDIAIESVSKIGYNFNGWFSDSGLTQSASLTIAKGSTGNLNYYAKWTAIEYSITYTLYGGTYSGESNPDKYTIEDVITLKSPALAGYEFDGWYTGTDGTGDKVSQITLGTVGNLNLYAKWLHISTITFNSNGGSAVNAITLAATREVSAPSNPSKNYYDFAGWYANSALTVEYEFTVMPEEDITVYAKWNPTVYSITYVLNGGTNASANHSEYTVESDTITLQNASKTGYTFIAWFDNAEFTGAVTEIATGSHGNITLYANYRINQYTLTFESNGGTSVEPITQNYATAVTEPSAPAKNGYEFAGWYKDSDFNNEYSFTTMGASNLTLYAKWDLAVYDIVYHLGGGTNNSANPQTYTINTATFTLGAPSKTGYTFKGWYADSEYSQAYSQIVTGSYGDKEVFAKYEVIVYSVTYNAPTGTVNGNIASYTIETDITALQVPTLKGHTFNGWFAEESYLTQVSHIAGGDIGNVVLYGKFTANTYDVWMDGNEEALYAVSFVLNGGTGSIATQTVNEETTLEYPQRPVKSGYLFGGWYDNAECEGRLFDFTAQVKKDTVLYANWISLGDATAIAVNETKSVSISGQNESVFKFVPLVSGNVTITATGSIDTYGKLYNDLGVLISQDDDSASDGLNFLIVYNVTAGREYKVVVRGFGSSISGQIQLSVRGNDTVSDGGYALTATKTSATFGGTFSLTVPEVRDGYKFLGYADDDGVMYTDMTGASIKNWDKDEDTVLYSTWERTVYTVTFVTNGGSAVESATLAFGDRLDLNDYVTTRSGYSFAGWFLNASSQDSYDASTMPDYNFTLYAKWKTFALGSIKYDTDKKAVSVNDTITADLFGAVCLDTSGNFATLTATVNGKQESGQTITVRLIATSGTKSKQATISDVKVYGMPTLSITNQDKGYINLNNGLAASWFGATGKDTYDVATTVNVRIDGEYQAGDTVTVYIDSVDPAGNVTTQSIEGVKLYGLPVITYNTQKTAIRVADTLNCTLFGATAVDSFGEEIDVSVTLKSGTKSAGNTITVLISATDVKGNVTDIEVDVDVYGLPVISDATKVEFKQDASDVISVETLGISATDTYGEDLDITLSITEGEKIGGETIEYTASVTDVAGNVTTKTYSVKIYGTPVITYDCEAIKDTDDPTKHAAVVSFNLNGGSGSIASQTVTDTQGLVYPAIPTRSGYVFAGWYSSSSCTGTAYDFTATVTDDITLYAKWISYSGTGILELNGTKFNISVYSKSSSSRTYYAFVPLVSGSISIYSTSSWDTYGFLYDSSKSQLTSNDDGGSDNNFNITYNVTAGTLYYVAPCGYSGSGTLTMAMSGAQMPADGGYVLGSNKKILNQAAVDSFGKPLAVTVTLKSGTVTAGTNVVYTLTATDHLGNVATLDTEEIGVYSAGDIVFTELMTGASDLVKYTSAGEEFFASATDSFGEACTITLEAASGYTFTAGNTVNLYVVATDKAGNKKFSELISGIKIYGMPAITFARSDYYILTGEDVTFLFASADSFGEELVLDITEDENTDARLVVTVTATDDAGNVNSGTYTLAKVSSAESYVGLYIGDNKVGYAVLEVGEEYTLPTEFEGYVFESWKLNGTAVTNENGVSLTAWNGEVQSEYKLYASGTATTYNVTYVLNGGTNSKNNPATYTILTTFGGLALEDAEKVTTTTTCVGDGLYRDTKTAYTFLGWYKDADFTEEVTELSCALGDVTLYAKWSATADTTTTDQTAYTREGSVIYFGTYPQSEVTDSTLKSTLTNKAGTLPTSSNSRSWTSYGYYISGSVSNYMWYIDVENAGEKYRGVYFTSYRQYDTGSSSSTGNTYQDDNGYYTSTVYWFKYEPIKWQILTESNGKAFLLCDIAIDSQDYYYSTSSHTVNGSTVYANNYAYSTIRAWLNDTFYNTAFNDLQKALIQTTTVDNSVSSTGHSSNSYACANTSDKVFLLSYVEATTYMTSYSARIRQSTDYAKSQGCWANTSSGYEGNCWWWLRSPSYYSRDYARGINDDGSVDFYGSVYIAYSGVVPALWIAL